MSSPSRAALTDIKTRAQHLRLDLTDKPAVSKVGSSMKDSGLLTACYAHSASAPGRHTQSHCLTTNCSSTLVSGASR